MLKIHQFVFGPVQENTYILYDEGTREAAIVDPGCMRHSEEEKLRAFIVEKELSPQLMLCTHQHFDHVWGAAYVLRTWASIAAYGNRIDFEQLPALGATPRLRYPLATRGCADGTIYPSGAG